MRRILDEDKQRKDFEEDHMVRLVSFRPEDILFIKYTHVRKNYALRG